MTIQEIKAISISNFLTSKGHEPVNKKGYKWWYLSLLHTEQTASFKVGLNKTCGTTSDWVKVETSLIWLWNYITRRTFQRYYT